MRRSVILVAALLTSSICGCAAAGEAVIDGMLDAALGDEDEIEIHPRILKRLGIEPDSEQHKRMLAEERARRDMRRGFNSN
jgi:hypothetical protein